MPNLIGNLVHETSTTTGTGDLTLAGAAETRYRTFNAAFGTGTTNRFQYVIHHRTALEWEVGIGYLSASTTLVRETITSSSNSGSAVSFSSGDKDVFCALGEEGTVRSGVPDNTYGFDNSYYYPTIAGQTGTDLIGTQANARTAPVLWPGGITIAEVVLTVTVAGTSGSVVRLGIYDSNRATGMPNNKLYDSTVITESTGVKTFSPSLFIPRGGRYWITVAPQGGPATQPTMRTLTGMTGLGFVGYNSNDPTFPATCYLTTGLSTTLPDPWSGTLLTTSQSFRTLFKIA